MNPLDADMLSTVLSLVFLAVMAGCALLAGDPTPASDQPYTAGDKRWP